MGSALLSTTIADPTLAEATEDCAARSGSAASLTAQALRHQVAERLAAHRSRRSGNQPAAAQRPSAAQTANTRAARIAATVAERYAHTQSYRAFLAAEAERAVQQARAAAEIAALNAQAVAQAQQQLLDTFDQVESNEAAHQQAAREHAIQTGIGNPLHEQATNTLPLETASQALADLPELDACELSLWPELDASKFRAPAASAPRHHRTHRAEPRAAQQPAANPEPRTSNQLTVRLYEDAASAAHVDLAGGRHAAVGVHSNHGEELNDAEAYALDEEIAFRQAPVFEEPAGPPMPLPANLIEFPRQLVASRKARPRYAEGPLRDEDAAPAPGDGQLRIFEVDPAQISTQPDTDESAAEAASPQWTSIWLDAPTAADFASPLGNEAIQRLPGEAMAAQHSGQTDHFPDAATIGRRALAAAINAAVLFAGLLAFAAVFVAIAGQWRPGTPLSVALARTGFAPSLVPGAAAVTLAVLYLLYQALFFSLSDSTPGMRSARIALCTFDDENPSRPALRRRIVAVLLSAVPFGLGLLWASLDEDRLTWHDRMARMYQRSY
jgi:uncharacterized RDD family membrane protein YckC